MAEFEEGMNLPQSNNLVPPPGVPSDAFEFESIRDLEIPPNLEVFNDALDSDLEMLMANQAQIINSLPGFETAGNINSPYPSGNNEMILPGGGVKRRNDLTSAEGVMNFMKGIEAKPTELPDQPKIADPIRIGSRNSNFDRYYNHGDFGELGFNPSIDNEAYYNANTNWFQEMGRMFPQFARTMGTGFMSSYRAIGDLFDGGPSSYFSEKDLTSAVEYADANRIGSSTSSGAWATNFTLNMGYSMGIIANIAVEEAALFAAAAVQGGLNPASDAALIVRTGYNTKRFFSAIGNAFNVVKMAKASRNLIRSLNKIENFKAFGSAVKTGGNFLGDILAPETVRAFKTIGTVAKTGENMTDLAKGGKILAGAYRDFRSLNMSMSESKMEGGMVFNNVLANGYTAKVLENQAAGLGSELTDKQWSDISENANKSSFSTIMRNAPLIYLTNQITLGTAFGGFKRSLPQAMKQGFEGLARRQIRTKAIRTAEGGIAKDVFEDAGESLMEDMFGVFSKQGFRKLKALGVKGSLLATAGGSLRYFAANFSEGAQELYQEAVANGVENYYNALMFDPSRDEAELYRASVNSALSSQWSSEGIQTFLSGFMMGGAMQGPQNLIFKGAPNLFSYATDKKGYKAAAEKREAEAVRITKQYNDAWNQQALDVGYLFDTNIDSFVKQHQSAKESTMAQYDGDHMDNIDAKHFSKFDFLVNLAESGNVGLFREQLNDLLEMSDPELGAAFPSATKQDIKSGKIRKRVQEMVDKSNSIEDLVSNSKDDSPNPHNPNKYQPGTREHGEEMRAYIAWKHVRYLKMFTKDALVNAGERRLKIADSLASHPVLGKIASNQLTTLLTKTGIEAEISRLAGELEVIEDNKDNKEVRNTMADRLALLGAVAEVLHSPDNATALKGRKKGAFDMRSFKKKLRGPVYEYLKHLAGSQDDIVVTDEIDNALEQIIDYQHLDERQDKYFMALEMLENPEELDRLRTRSREYLEEYYKHRLARFKDIVDKTAFKKDIKDFLGKLAEKGVFISQEEFNEFIKTGDLDKIKAFFSEKGQLNPIEDPQLLKEVVAIREQFREILLSQHQARKQKVADSEQKITEKSDVKKQEEDLEWEEENDVEIDEDITLYGEKDENPVLKALLTRKYNSVVASMNSINKSEGTSYSIPDQNEWLATILPKLNWVESYRKLKSLWGATLNIPNKNQRDAIYAQDKGFLKWLALSAEQDPRVADIIKLMPNITITDFLESYEAPSMRKDEKGKRKTKLEIEGKFYGVKKVTKRNSQTGEKLEAFSVVDLRTGDRPGADILKTAGISHSAFANIAEAKKAMKALDSSVSETTPFKFDKDDSGNSYELNYGMILINKTTKEKFIVLSKAKDVVNSTDGYVLIAPLDKYNELIKAKASRKEILAIREKILHGEIKSSWDIPLFKFEKSSQDLTKISLDEAVKIMPYKDGQESSVETALRFSIINQILTEDEIKNGINVVVERNNVEPGTPRERQRFGQKDKNSQLTFLKESLTIRLEFDDATFNKLQLAFEALELGIEPNKTFGFLKNDTVSIKDLNGNVINPLNITDEIAENTFENWANSASTDIIKRNFAVQKVYLRAIYDKLGDSDIAKKRKAIKDKYASQEVTSVEDYEGIDDGKTIYVQVRTYANGSRKVYSGYEKNKYGNVTNQVDTIAEEMSTENYIATIYSEDSDVEGMSQTGVRTAEEASLIKAKNKMNQELAKLAQEQTTGEATLKLSDIEGFDLNATAGSMLFTERGVETLLSNLNFNSVDGNKVLIVNTKSSDKKGKTTVATKIITDFEGTAEEEIEFEEKILNDINTQSPSMLDSIKKSGRYVMIVKTANGKYSYAPIKTTRINKEELNDVFGEMLEVALEIQDSNFASPKKGVKKKRIQEKSQKLVLSDKFGGLTLSEWNQNLNNKFFISGIPGYNFELNVTTNGHLNLSIYDTKKGIRIDAFLDNNESIKNYSGADNQIELLESLIDEAKATAASVEYGERTDVKLSIDNFRESFERTGVSLDEIYEKSSTTLSPLAPRIDIKIKVDVDSVNIQNEMNLAAQVNNAEKKENNANPKKSKTDNNDIDLLTDDEFNEIFTRSDGLTILSDGQLAFIAKKIYDNKKGLVKTLTPRYKQIADAYKVNADIREQLDPLIMKLVQLEKNPQSKALNTKKSINERLSEINNEITGIENEFDISADEDEINNDPRIKKLRAEESELIKKRKDANKIISPDLNIDDVEDIDVFLEWAKQNLPEWMNILDIDQLGNNLKKGGLRVGAFVMGMRDISGGLELDGTIYTGAKSPFRYHEAWHGVFRMLLTTEQQNELYGIAEKEVLAKMRSKKGYEISKGVYTKSMSEAVELLKNSADTYENMSIEELRKEVLEEYMADEFEKFKKNPKSTSTDSSIKSFFTKLLEWLKSIFSSYNSTSLRPFFEKVDSGNFRLAGIAENGFTESARTGVVIEANAIIPYDSYTDEFGDEVELVLTQDLATSIVTAISARVVSRQMKFKPSKKEPAFDLKKEVEDSFNMHKALYNVKNPIYKTDVILNTADKKKKLRTLHKAFTENERAIREGVVSYMELFGVKLSIEENEVDEFEMEFGLRSASEYGKDASMIGGFNSLSKEMRMYFATTTLSEKDFLGNDILDPETNEPLIVAVDFATVYNGFMKVGSGAKTSLEILQRLWTFSRNNPQTRAVADRIFTDLNITGEEVMAGDLQNLDSILAPVIVSAFQNFKVDSWFIHRVNNSNQDNHLKVYTYSAANRDDVNRQIESWEIEWRKKWRSLKDGQDVPMLNKGLKALDSLRRYIGKKRKSLSEKDLDGISKKISADLNEAFGISIAPLFIKFSMAKELTSPTQSQELLIDMYTDNEQISLEAIDELIDALSRKDAESGKASPADILNKNLDENVYNRLREISRQNAPFDENIGVSMFNNPNGDLVYAHQLPSFNLKQIEALNRHDELMDKIKRDYPDDPILNSPAFEAMSRKKMFKVRRISGIKESAYLEKTEDDDLLVGTVNDQGKTYGDLNPKEFAAAQINSYLGTYNDKSGQVEMVIDKDGVEHGISPHLMRVAEASNTGDSVPMAVIQAVETDSQGRTVLTDKSIDTIVSNIESEFERIVDEFGRNPSTDKIEGYNVTNGVLDENGRAFKFHNNETSLTPLNFASGDVGRAEEVNILKDELDLMQDEDSNINVLVQKSQMPGHLIEGTIKDVLITPFNRPKKKGGKFEYLNGEKVLVKMRYVGPRKLANLTQQQIYDQLGELISATKKDTHQIDVKINNVVMHTTTHKIKNLIEKNETVYFYEKVDENAESEIRELTGYASELLAEIKKAKSENNLENFTLEDALKAMGSNITELRTFISTRMDQEFASFQLTLKDIGLSKYDISIDITKGIDSAAGANKASIGKTNRIMNMTEDYDYNLKQIFINDFINTTAINKLLMGDESLSLKNAIDQVKRNKGAIAAYYSAKSDLPINKSSRELGITEIIDEINLIELTEPVIEGTFNKDNETEIADAQAYMTIKGFKYTYFGFGKLHPALASLLDKVEAGEEVTSEEYFAAGGKEGLAGHAKMQHMLNSKKYVYYDGKRYLKMSVIFLSKDLTSVKKNGKWVAKRNMRAMHNLRVNLEKSETKGKLSMSASASAIKMMKTNLISHEDILGGELTSDELNGTSLDPEYLGLQVINPSNKLTITDPTQIKTIITSQQNENTEVVMLGYNNNEPIPLKDIKDMYNASITNRNLLGYTSKRNLIFNLDSGLNLLERSITDKKIDPDLMSFLQYAKDGLMASGSQTDIIPYFTIDPETGEQQYDLNNPKAVSAAKRLFMTYFNSSVISEKVPGISAALVSDLGMRVFRRVYEVDENGKPLRSEVIRERDFTANYSDSDISFDLDDGDNFKNDVIDGLASAVKNSNGKGVIIVDRLRDGVMRYTEDGVATGERYTESMLPAHTADEHDLLYNTTSAIPEAVAKKFGIRIPSQDHHSSLNIMVVDFIPTFYGSSIVSARELIEKSGADFDIDKLYIQIKEYYVTESNTFVEYGNIFEHYAIYQNIDVDKRSSTLSEAAKKYNTLGNKKLSDKKIEDIEDSGLNLKTWKALTVLGLPTTKSEYKEYLDNNKIFGNFSAAPYSAALNNTILDLKTALLGNKTISDYRPLYKDNITGKNTPKSLDGAGKQNTFALNKEGERLYLPPVHAEPADIKPLTDVWKEIESEFPILAEEAREDGLNVNNLRAKVKAFDNNKAGAKSIGAVVLPNLYLSLLTDYNIKLMSTIVDNEETQVELKFNGRSYSTFGGAYEILEDGTAGQRKQYIISALITAMTDNAKERLAARLKLSISTLGVVTNMIALGVPLKTAILIVNTPIIKENYKEILINDIPTKFSSHIQRQNDAHPGSIKILRGMLEILDKNLSEEDVNDRIDNANINQDLLGDSINDPISGFMTTEQGDKFAKDILAEKDSGRTEFMIQKIIDELAIIQMYIQATIISDGTKQLKNLMNLASGYDKEKKSEIPDVLAAIDYYHLYDDNASFGKLGPMETPIIDVRKIFGINPKVKAKTWQSNSVKQFVDFLTYLPNVFMEYTPNYQLFNGGIIENADRYKLMGVAGKKLRKTMNEDVLSFLTLKAYMHKMQNSKQGSVKIKALNQDLLYGDNDIASMLDEAFDLLGDDAATNTWLEDFAIWQEKTDPANDSGIALLQHDTFKKLSYTEKINSQIGLLNIMGTKSTADIGRNTVFYTMVKEGLQQRYRSIGRSIGPQLIGDYLDIIPSVHQALMSDNKNAALNVFGVSIEDLLNDYTENYMLASSSSIFLQSFGYSGGGAGRSLPNDLIYDPFEKASISKKHITAEMAEDDLDTVYFVFDNEMQNGEAGSLGSRDEKNVITFVTKKSLGIEEGAYFSTEEEQNTAVADLKKQFNKLIKLKEGRDLMFQPLIGKAEAERLKKHSPILYKELNNYLVQIGYKLYNKTVTNKKTGKTTVVVDKNPLSSALYLDKSKPSMPIMRIDIFKAFGLSSKFQETDSQTISRKASIANNKTNKAILSNTTGWLASYGFKVNYGEKLADTTISFPAAFKIKIDGKFKTFKLVQVAAKNMIKDRPLHAGKINKGSYAAYVEVIPVGSKYAWGGSFMFPGNINNIEEINERIQENSEEVSEENTGEPRYDLDEVFEDDSTDDSPQNFGDGTGFDLAESNEGPIDDSKYELDKLADKKGLGKQVLKYLEEAADIAENPTKDNKAQSDRLNAAMETQVDKLRVQLNYINEQIKNGRDARKAQNAPYTPEEIQDFKKDQATYQDLITKLQGNDKAEALYSLVMLTVDKMKDVIGVNAATVLALDVIKSCL
tara:strand:- start:1087 stop:17001 length:15915 start_codon:yes stop_codon:yes gene_type:complete